jgi:hypothetical protein
MEAIIELCEMVSPLKVRHLKLIGDKEDQAGQLYDLIKSNKVISDQDAMDQLFPDKKYARIYLNGIKDKLSQRLMNTLLFLDQNQDTPYKKAFIGTYRLFLVYKILSFSGKRKAARTIAQKAVKKATKFHFLEIAVPFARELKTHYATIEPNKKQFQKYRTIQMQQAELLQKEMEVEDMFCQLALLQVKKQHKKEELKEMRTFAQRAENIIHQYSTYWLLYLAGNIIVIWHQMKNHHQEVTRYCNLMLKKLGALPYQVPTPAIFGFNIKQIPGYVLNKEFDKAEQVLKKCIAMYQPGQINWVKAMQFKTIMHFHQKEYSKALKTAHTINTQFKNTLRDQETWQIYEAYGKILTGEKLRLHKLLNEVPKYSKDKRGMNINILIIRILEYIRRDKVGEVIDNTNAINQYAYRYLRQDDTFRSNCFIRMLLQLEKGHFNQVGVRRHTGKLLKKLKSMPLRESQQDYEVEIVPYEDLWDFLINLLPKKP